MARFHLSAIRNIDETLLVNIALFISWLNKWVLGKEHV